MGVKQIGGPVQCHHGLACARPTLNGVHAGHGGTDDVVLLGLDGADDVAESPCAGCLKGGNKGTLPFQPGAVPVSEPFEVSEQLILEAQHGAPSAHNVTPALQAHGYRTGGPVEGLGYRSPPVHHDRILLFVPDTDPTNVEYATPGLGLLVDPTEDQRGVAQVQVVEAGRHRVDDGLALKARLIGATLADLDHPRQVKGPFTGCV